MGPAFVHFSLATCGVGKAIIALAQTEGKLTSHPATLRSVRQRVGLTRSHEFSCLAAFPVYKWLLPLKSQKQARPFARGAPPRISLWGLRSAYLLARTNLVFKSPPVRFCVTLPKRMEFEHVFEQVPRCRFHSGFVGWEDSRSRQWLPVR